MIFRDLKYLFAAAALMSGTMAAVASPALDTSGPLCRKPEYPARSLRDSEEGVSVLAFLIGTDGRVVRSAVLSTSGSADLDHAAQRALSKCVFKPATDGGKAVEMWVPVQYRWSIHDDPGTRNAQHEAEIAASKGDLAARYRLFLILLGKAKTDAEREQAMTVLRSAADLGYAHAQFGLGERYERGDGVKVDIEEALRWYQKAAAQGHVLAIQRLQVGALPQ